MCGIFQRDGYDDGCVGLGYGRAVLRGGVIRNRAKHGENQQFAAEESKKVKLVLLYEDIISRHSMILSHMNRIYMVVLCQETTQFSRVVLNEIWMWRLERLDETAALTFYRERP